MCVFGSGSLPHDDSAEIARQDEQARQDRITAGQKAIDEAFVPFDDTFYGKISSDYTGYYEPQLDEQYQKAREKQTLALANSGNLTSSSGATTLADLKRAYDRQKTAMADAALGAANELRTQVASNKTDLYNINRSAADPTQASSLAATRVGNLSAPQTFSPLGDLFSSMIKTGTNNALLAAGSGSTMGNYFFAPSTSGTGSSAMVV